MGCGQRWLALASLCKLNDPVFATDAKEWWCRISAVLGHYRRNATSAGNGHFVLESPNIQISNLDDEI